MPQIPTLQNQVSTQAAPNIQVRPLENTVGQSIGAGAENLGEAVDRERLQQNLEAQRAAFMDADRQTDQLANNILSAARSTQGKDAIGITPNLLQQYDEQTANTAKTLRGRHAQMAYQEAVNQRRAQLQLGLENHEGQQREAYYAKSRQDYMDQAHINAVTQYQDPKAIEGEINKVRAAVDQTPGVDDAEKATELGVRRSGIYTGVIQRYLANDQINGAQKYYDSIKDKVNGDKAAYIENAINDARRIAEARARARADHTEAIAGRAMNEIDRQIASGVPATPAMWTDWGNKVRGTSYADEFKGRLDDEREVQDTLRKPVEDQLRLVQQKQAELTNGGGSVRQAENVQRLSNAVRQNIAQVQSSPLVYAEQRLGQKATPIDTAAFLDPAQQADVGATLQERAATLTTVAKTTGIPVQNRPLLPQEAAELSSVLDRAGPQDSAKIFANLRNAAGSTDIFKGALQQISPDSPTKLAAGLLAAERADLTTETHWFSPDTSITSQDASATILRGDALLNPSKTDKAQDGKPKTSKLLLPEAAMADLQAKFSDQVGDAFKGRSELADKAFQTVLAYYVGKADKEGRLAADKQSVQTRDVQDAVHAVLGNVVDYNGKGQVLPPWGMSEHDFKDRVEKAFQQKMADMNVPQEAMLNLGRLGLTNTNKDGQYALTDGDNFILDANRNPVTINLQVAKPEDRRGYIVR